MSLETLLEAAEFLEWRNQSKTRADDSTRDPHGYTRSSPANGSDASPDSSNSAKIVYIDPDEARDKRRAGGAGTREVHNKLEKNRRAHLKECFDFLKQQIPTLGDKITSNLSILQGSIRYIQALKRKEKEYELEMQRLAQEKIGLQEKITILKSELAKMNIDVDLNKWVTLPDEQDTNSTNTATEQGSPICSEDEDEEEDDMDIKNKPLSSLYSVIEKSHKMALPRLPPQQQPPVVKKDVAMLKASTPTSPITPSRAVPQMMSKPINFCSTSTTLSKSTTVQSQAGDSRPAITQLLARTLEKRQRQQQNSVANSSSVTVTSAGTTTSNIKSVPVPLKTPMPLRQPFTLPIATQFVAPTANLQMAAYNKLAAQADLSPNIAAIPMSTLAKTLNQPILVSTPLQNLHMASLAANHPNVNNSAAPNAPANPVTTVAMVTSTTASVAIAGTKVSTPQTTPSLTQSLPVTAMATVQTMRPLLGASAQHMFGHIPFNLMQRTSMAPVLSAVSNTTGPSTAAITSATSQNTAAVQQIISLAQMTQGTIVSPMTVLSQQPLLKHIPLFPQGNIQGILQGATTPMGGVVGQPIVKPVVVVSLPSVVTSAPSTTMSMTLAPVTTAS